MNSNLGYLLLGALLGFLIPGLGYAYLGLLSVGFIYFVVIALTEYFRNLGRVKVAKQ